MIRPVLSASSYLVAGTLVQAILAFAGNIVLLRALDPAEFGRFAVTLAGISLIASILSLRLGVVIIRTSDSEFTADFQRRYFTAIVAEAAVVSVISGLWLIVSGSASWTGALLVAAVGIQTFCHTARAFWERTMPYRRIAMAETLIVAIAQIVGVAVVVATQSDAALYWREAASAVATLALLKLFGGLTFHPLTWPRLYEWRSVLREARVTWLDSILEGIFQRFTVIAVALMAGDRGAGLFSMAQRLAVLPHQVIQPFGRVAANWFSRNTTPTDRRAGRNQLILLLLLPLSLAALLMVVVADTLVPGVFGEHWREAVPVLVAMGAVMIFMTVFEITRSYALVMKQTGALLWARAAQFGAFAAGIGAGWMTGGNTLVYAGAGLSAAFTAAFIVQLVLIRRRDAA